MPSKYPSLGILDALYKLLFGFPYEISKQGLYESLGSQSPPLVQYSKILYSLEHGGYINRMSGKIGITVKGKKKAKMRTIEQISLSKIKDGAYRLIAFDIPEKMRHTRDIIRSKLKAFECTKLQKSLYLTPYVCEHEIREISRILQIERYVKVLKIDASNFRGFDDRIK